MTRWWPLLVIVAAVALTAASADAATGRCDAHRRGVVLRTSKVIVFTKRGEEGARRFYACRRHRGRAIFVGLDLPDDGYYGSDSTVRRVRAKGFIVSVRITEGAASATACSKYAGYDCPPVRVFRRVVDTRTGVVTNS
jgi:hypothetical protein